MTANTPSVPDHTGCACGSVARRPTRRRVLSMPAKAGALAALGAGVDAVLPPRPARAAEATTTRLQPEAAITRLLAGNDRYAGAKPDVCAENLARIWHATESGQTPFAAVLSCADSRVPVELVFDEGVGQVFVARVAGNIASPDVIATLEYGVAVLGISAIMVLGHGNCGAVAATIARKAAPGQISSLYAFIRPAVEEAGRDLDAAIKLNAVMQARLLGQASPVLAGAIGTGRLAIPAAYYDVKNGRVSLLEGGPARRPG
jgi:carbonic anhydrase